MGGPVLQEPGVVGIGGADLFYHWVFRGVWGRCGGFYV